MNLMIHAPSGAGKTTRFIIPMVLDLVSNNKKSSCFVLDPKGEVLEATNDYLQKNNIKVVVLDADDIANSIGSKSFLWIFSTKAFDNIRDL